MQDYFASLGTIDVAALIVIGFNALMGLIRGFTWQLVRLATIVAGLCLARYFAADVALRLGKLFNVSEPADRILAYFVIFFAVFLVGTILARLLRKAISSLRLQSFDRLLGTLLGVVKGVAIVVVVVLLLSQLKGVPSLQNSLATSESARLTQAVVQHVKPLFPESLRQEFSDWLEKLRKSVPQTPLPEAPPK